MSKHRSLPDPQRRQKSKFELEHIHLDELLNAAGMSGYLGVLDPPASAPHLEQLAKEMLDEMQSSGRPLTERYQSGSLPGFAAVQTPDPKLSGTPETGTPIKGTPETGITEKTIPATEALSGTIEKGTQAAVVKRGVPDSGIGISGVTESGTPYFRTAPIARRRIIRQAQLVQDGHSYGEQLVYQTLWDHAQAHSADARIITIGYRTLSAYCNLTVNNCKANLLSLIRKLSIVEVIEHSATQGKTYLVFNFATILKRRRGAGLTHYVKHRGVTFVDAVSGEELDLSGIPETGIPHSQEGTPLSEQKGAPVSGTQLLEQSERQDSSLPASSSSAIRAALERIAPVVDEAAVRQLQTLCEQAAPTVTLEEIVWLIETKAALVNHRLLRNPLGFLLTAIPRCLEGKGLEALRRYRQADMPVAGAELEAGAWRLEMQRVLDNPLSLEEDRRFAVRLLAGDVLETGSAR